MQSDVKRLGVLFQKMSNDGFNTMLPLRWGYYFIDSDSSRLEAIFNYLKNVNYTFESITQIGNNEWRLHVTKVEVLTAEKLHQRNLAFNNLAVHFAVAIYDGWDVEKI